MTLDEKIEKLKKDTIEYARLQASNIITEQQESVSETKKAHIDSQNSKTNLSIKSIEEELKREENKIFSQNLIKLKRIYNDKVNSYKDEIFNDVKSKLSKFMNTDDYLNLLIKWILEALEFARDEEVHIYINPGDKDKLNILEKETNATIMLSSYDFIGGTRAVVRSRNVLIDHSFSSLFERQFEMFHFEEGENS